MMLLIILICKSRILIFNFLIFLIILIILIIEVSLSNNNTIYNTIQFYLTSKALRVVAHSPEPGALKCSTKKD